MDIIFAIKYKIERKLENHLERELQKLFNIKWLAQQNQDHDLFEDCRLSINLLTQKLEKQKEVITEIKKGLPENKIKALEETLKKEQKEVKKAGSYLLDSEKELSNSSSKTKVSSSLTEKMERLTLDDEFELN